MNGVKFRLSNNSRFSIKDNNRNLKDIFSSYTLFSALINNINLIYGDEKATKVVEQFSSDEFSISSMFIGLDFYNIDTEEIENTLYFVPKPEAIIENIDIDKQKLEENVIKRKKAKKIKMISLQALKQIGMEWVNSERKFNFDLFNLVNIGADLACTQDELKSIETKDINEFSFEDELSRPHVKVDRITSNSENFFYQDEKIYKYEYVGKYRIEPFMYFMYSGELSTELKSAINLIVDEGIGGRRSTGMGTFLSNEYVEIDLVDELSSNIFITLSSYSPLAEEVDNLLGYKLEKINGYIYYEGGQPFRKKSIGVIREGAVTSKRVRGQMVDVTPFYAKLPNRAYCNGKAFSIGIGGAGNE